MNIMEKAKLARSFFEMKNRADSNESIWVAKDSAPDWVSDLCQDAHNEMLPDDFIYETIVDSLDAIAESNDKEEAEEIQLESDVYNKDLLNWLSSHSSRVERVDAMMEEMGFNPTDGIISAISAGQSDEKREVLANVINLLDELDLEEAA